MKFIRLFFFAFLFWGVAGVATAQKQYQIVNIGFYNLENFFDTVHQEGKNDIDFTPKGVRAYNSETYWKKVHNLASVIKDLGTDVSPDGPAVMGLSELENRSVLHDLVNDPQVKARNYQIVHYESPDVRGIDVGLIYNPKYFAVDTSFPMTVSLPSGSHNGVSATRDVLLVKGKLKGETFYFFVNHWPSRLGGEAASAPSRAIAAGVGRRAMDSILKTDPKANMILMGDLNDNPDNKSLTKVLRANGDIKDTDPGTLYNPWLAYFSNGVGTLAYQDAWSLFDQIVLSRNIIDKTDPTAHFFFYKAKIFHRKDMIQESGRYKGYPKRTYDFDRFADGYSDHFPTFVTLLKQLETVTFDTNQ